MTKEQLTDLISSARTYYGSLDMASIHPLVVELSEAFSIAPTIAQKLIVGFPAQVIVDGIGQVTVPDLVEDDDAAILVREGKITELVNRICERR